MKNAPRAQAAARIRSASFTKPNRFEEMMQSKLSDSSLSKCSEEKSRLRGSISAGRTFNPARTIAAGTVKQV